MFPFIGKLESKKEDIRYGRTIEGNSDILQILQKLLLFILIFTFIFWYSVSFKDINS